MAGRGTREGHDRPQPALLIPGSSGQEPRPGMLGRDPPSGAADLGTAQSNPLLRRGVLRR